MLLTDRMKGTRHAALHDGEEALRRLHADAILEVLFLSVVDRAVFGALRHPWKAARVGSS